MRKEMQPTPVIFDCDPGHDDAIALLLALGSPELHLLGVVTSYGNQTLAKTTVNALRLLQFAGRTDIPVAVGADQPLQQAQCVHRSLGKRLVAVRCDDAQQVDLRAGEREQQRDRVVVAGVAIENYGCGLHCLLHSLAEVYARAFVRALARVSFGFAVGTKLTGARLAISGSQLEMIGAR